MEWSYEVGKVVGSAILGFLIGRLQTSYTDNVSRTKDIQNELLKAIRACTTSAIDYHSLSVAKEIWGTKAIHLKNQLYRIRTDVYVIKKLCKRNDDVLLSNFVDFFDAVTEYPFEANELPQAPAPDRFIRISVTAEKLVQELTTCRPKLF